MEIPSPWCSASILFLSPWHPQSHSVSVVVPVLDVSHKWTHTPCGHVAFCIWLLSLSMMFSVSSTYNILQSFTPFHDWVIFQCVDRPYCVYPLTSSWTLGLFLLFWVLWIVLLSTWVYMDLLGNNDFFTALPTIWNDLLVSLLFTDLPYHLLDYKFQEKLDYKLQGEWVLFTSTFSAEDSHTWRKGDVWEMQVECMNAGSGCRYHTRLWLCGCLHHSIRICIPPSQRHKGTAPQQRGRRPQRLQHKIWTLHFLDSRSVALERDLCVN